MCRAILYTCGAAHWLRCMGDPTMEVQLGAVKRRATSSSTTHQDGQGCSRPLTSPFTLTRQQERTSLQRCFHLPTVLSAGATTFAAAWLRVGSRVTVPRQQLRRGAPGPSNQGPSVECDALQGARTARSEEESLH